MIRHASDESTERSLAEGEMAKVLQMLREPFIREVMDFLESGDEGAQMRTKADARRYIRGKGTTCFHSTWACDRDASVLRRDGLDGRNLDHLPSFGHALLLPSREAESARRASDRSMFFDLIRFGIL